MRETVLAGILRDAMGAERDGYTFYSLAAERADDPGAREMFAQLAEDERRHYEALQAGYRSLAQGGRWDPSMALEKREEPTVGGIFSEDFARRIRGKHLEMSALSIGILLERNAYEFYSRQADQAEEEPVVDFFRELAAWEETHYRRLLRQDEAIKETYWSENRYAPLL